MKNTRLQQMRLELKEHPELGTAPRGSTVASALGMSAGNFSAVERGAVRLGIRSAMRLADFYKTTPEEILGAWEEARVVFLEGEMEALRESIRERRRAARAQAKKKKKRP